MALVDKTAFEDAGRRLSEATAGDFLALLKPRVMSLVVFTAFVGLVAAPVQTNPFIAVIAILCIAIGAGASGALNMWYDADIDAVMSRTAKRPIPSGRVEPGEALAFGLVLSVLSVMTLGVLVNWLAAALLAFTIFFYAVVYTMWLKRWTPQNIVIGGAAGAIPPVIGWAAATGIGQPRERHPVPDHLPLDAAAFLGARAVQGRGLWPRRRADDAERRRPRLDAPPDLRLHADRRAGRRAALRCSATRRSATAWSRPRLGARLRLVCLEGAASCPTATRSMKPAKALFAYSLLYLFAIFAAYLADVSGPARRS